MNAIFTEYNRTVRRMMEENYEESTINLYISVVWSIFQSNPANVSEGPRTSVEGPRTSVEGPRTSVEGPRTSVEGPRTSVEGPRTSVEGPTFAFDHRPINYIVPTEMNRRIEGLTEEQITQYTRMIPYDSTMNEHQCPITMLEFVEGEEVCEITGCRHFFKKEGIVRWLQTHNKCPICRTVVMPTTTRPDESQFDAPEFTSSFIQNIIQRVLERQNLGTIDSFTFEMPMPTAISNSMFRQLQPRNSEENA